MTIRMFMVVIAVLAAGKVLAQEGAKPPPFDPGSYPLEVQRALHYASDECATQGGGEVTFAPDTVRKLDLTGDGRDDTSCLSATQNAPDRMRQPLFAGAAAAS